MSKQYVFENNARESEDEENPPQSKRRRTLQERNGKILTDSFSYREKIAKQPVIEYEQTCPICSKSFPNCMKMKQKRGKESYFAEHLRECMLESSEEDLKKLTKCSSKEQQEAILEAIFKRLSKYENLIRICDMERRGLNRVLRVAFGKDSKMSSREFLERKRKPCFERPTQKDVDEFFEPKRC